MLPMKKIRHPIPPRATGKKKKSKSKSTMKTEKKRMDESRRQTTNSTSSSSFSLLFVTRQRSLRFGRRSNERSEDRLNFDWIRVVLLDCLFFYPHKPSADDRSIINIFDLDGAEWVLYLKMKFISSHGGPSPKQQQQHRNCSIRQQLLPRLPTTSTHTKFNK
jgi:hypothetical protein